jgi:hypothetical protein
MTDQAIPPCPCVGEDLRDYVRIDRLFLSREQPDLRDGEIEFHAYKRWARVGAGEQRQAAERLALACAWVAKSHWLGSGAFRGRALSEGRICVERSERIQQQVEAAWATLGGSLGPPTGSSASYNYPPEGG